MAERKKTTVKGDWSRVSDIKAFNKNHDEIDWGRDKVETRVFYPDGWFDLFVCNKCGKHTSEQEWNKSELCSCGGTIKGRFAELKKSLDKKRKV